MSKFQVTVITAIAVIVIVSTFLASCSAGKKVTIPVSSTVAFEDTYTIIWNGYSKAYHYKEGNWQRAESFDYYFDVIQKRYPKEWKSVKSLHRIHPDYNGKAGQRDQTMYFGLSYTSMENTIVKGSLSSSLGDGTIATDEAFRNATINIQLKNANKFMPYNKITITQHYDYEQGKLTETVLLLKSKNCVDTPFMKNEEEAFFYVKGRLNEAPTRYN